MLLLVYVAKFGIPGKYSILASELNRLLEATIRFPPCAPSLQIETHLSESRFSVPFFRTKLQQIKNASKHEPDP